MNWKNVVLEWKRANNNKYVNKATLSLLLENAVQRVSEDTVKNGFRKCGLYPYNVEAIDFNKCMQDSSRIFGVNEKGNDIDKLKPTEFKVPHFLYFESVIPLQRRKEFKAAETGDWMGDECAKELFEVWKKLKFRCKRGKEEMNNEAIAEATEKEVLAIEDYTETHDGVENNSTRETIEIVENDNDIRNVNKNGLSEDAKNLYEIDENQIDNCDTKKDGIVEEILKNSQQNENIAVEKENQEKRILIHNNIVLVRPTTPTQNIKINQEHHKISTSFLDHIFWPEESLEKNSKVVKRERLPFASTSQRWLQYHEDKQKLKKQKEEDKREKAILRKRKREEKLQEATNKKKVGVRNKAEK